MLRGLRQFGVLAARAAREPVKPYEKFSVVDTDIEENLQPRSVAPFDVRTLDKGNMVAHILAQYRATGEYDAKLTGWRRAIGEKLVTTFNLDMDRIRSGPAAGVVYRDRCKMQGYFEKGVPLSPTASFYYERLGLPQTYFQWFQITSLHVWMLYVRMRRLPRQYCREYQKKLVNGIFEDIDYTLREVIRVHSDRITNNMKKRFSQQLRGSVFSYDEAMLGDDTVLAGALWRNLFTQSEIIDLTVLEHLVHYVRTQLYVMDQMSDKDFAAGYFHFMDPRLRYEPLTTEQYARLDELIEATRHDSRSPVGSKLSREGL